MSQKRGLLIEQQDYATRIVQTLTKKYAQEGTGIITKGHILMTLMSDTVNARSQRTDFSQKHSFS